ncbi:MAG: hypothetical protein GX241_08060 [Ruminococcaceae bacterium]|nr:hypothetical protein [Oscillospiraceae bacterium]
MGHFVSIRGWIECEEGDIIFIKEIMDNFCRNYTKHFIKEETKKLYQKGWQIPNEFINWSAYIFYGADIREYHTDFIKDQIIAIAASNKEIEGYFHVDDDEGNIKVSWKLYKGELIVSERK